MIKKIKKFNASVLIVTMMILGIVLTTALSVSVVSLKERKASMGTSKSNQAYQTADTGIEKVMDAILTTRDDSAKIVSQLTGFTCVNGILTPASGGYTVKLTANGDSGERAAVCSDKLTDIVAIKSVGTAGQTQRAIEAAVAAVPGYTGELWKCTCPGNPYLGGSILNNADQSSVKCDAGYHVAGGHTGIYWVCAKVQ